MLLDKLPVTPGYLTPILEYYESSSVSALTRKITSIESFKGILSPMVQSSNGWQPDLSSRYFQEDFNYGLRFIHDIAHSLGIDVPNIDRIYEWGIRLMKENG